MDLAMSIFGNHSSDGYISGKDIGSVMTLLFYIFELFYLLCTFLLIEFASPMR